MKKEINDEELLKILEEKNESNEDLANIYNINDTVSFLFYFKIVPGPHKVTPNLLYSLYSQWSKRPVERTKFFSELNKYIIKEDKYFLIDKDIFTLSSKSVTLLINKKQSSNHAIRNQNFKNFIEEYEITPGNFWLEEEILYHFYYRWTYDNRKRPMVIKYFSKFLELFFKNNLKIVKKQIFIGLDNKILDYIDKNTIKSMRDEAIEKSKNKKRKS